MSFRSIRSVAHACVVLACSAVAAIVAAAPSGLAQTPSGQSQNAPNSPPAKAMPAKAPEVPYEVVFDGFGEASELESLIRGVSVLLSDIKKPPQSRIGLRQRARSDVGRFDEAARSLGYYAASFKAGLAPSPSPSPAQPVKAPQSDAKPEPKKTLVTVTAEPGPRYLITEITVDPVGSAIRDVSIPTERLGIAIGDPAAASPVVKAESNLIRFLQENGRPLAKAVDRKVLVDHGERAMRITYTIDPGAAARFGAVSVRGATQVDPTFILRRMPWTYGDKADVRRLEAGRAELVASGVFSAATVRFGDAVDAEGLIPIVVTVTEAKRRSIGAGLSASTDEGFSSSVFWTHRNLFGGAERLSLRGTLGQVETSANLDFRVPDVLWNDQDLVITSNLVSETTETYDATRYAIGARLERRLSKTLSIDYGVSFERSRIDEDGDEDQFTLIGLPLGLKHDTSDDLLNPTKGGRSRLTYTPFLEELGSSVGFHVFTARHSRYLKLDEAGDFVLAGRAGFGAIIGADTDSIPADHRLYAGGSGSVRGYKRQSIGPLDLQNEGLGGRSMVELGLELRWRLFDDFGLVPFIDGGQIYDGELPDPGQEIQWAAGLGARYYTAIGPIRVDLAFPLNGRPSDDTFQVYFSLGQAF
jgi:translocation and assembly module TamA